MSRWLRYNVLFFLLDREQSQGKVLFDFSALVNGARQSLGHIKSLCMDFRFVQKPMGLNNLELSQRISNHRNITYFYWPICLTSRAYSLTVTKRGGNWCSKNVQAHPVCPDDPINMMRIPGRPNMAANRSHRRWSLREPCELLCGSTVFGWQSF